MGGKRSFEEDKMYFFVRGESFGTVFLEIAAAGVAQPNERYFLGVFSKIQDFFGKLKTYFDRTGLE